nr:hypothetical protein [uncultured Dyadobacter sp.]
MENVKAIVKQVVKIWGLYKTQQLVLTVAMREEIPFPLRKSLSRDYMICSLLKKEIANFYDALRCCMGDACIMRPERNTSVAQEAGGSVSAALGEIVHGHRQIIEEYGTLLNMAEGSNINTMVFHQHRKQMNTMTDELTIQSEKLKEKETQYALSH